MYQFYDPLVSILVIFVTFLKHFLKEFKWKYLSKWNLFDQCWMWRKRWLSVWILCWRVRFVILLEHPRNIYFTFKGLVFVAFLWPQLALQLSRKIALTLKILVIPQHTLQHRAVNSPLINVIHLCVIYAWILNALLPMDLQLRMKPVVVSARIFSPPLSTLVKLFLKSVEKILDNIVSYQQSVHSSPMLIKLYSLLGFGQRNFW